MVEIKHLSITVKNPETAAKALAEMTGGKPHEFRTKNMVGAWVCIWDEKTNHLIEFLPDSYLMHPTETGANFRKLDIGLSFNSSHFQLEVKTPLSDIKAIANRYSFHHYFRPRQGGPLYEVWFEDQFLVEFVSDEIRALVDVPAAVNVQ